MPDIGLAPVSNRAASRFIDRRTLLVGAAGALAAAGLSGPARAAGSATSPAARASLQTAYPWTRADTLET